jgi:hypothetical protein
MDAIRAHRLYPRLVALITEGVQSGKSEAKVAKMADGISPAELTIYRLLYDACYWRNEPDVASPNTTKLYYELNAVKPDGITPDGYIADYAVSMLQLWPACVKDLALAGIMAIRNDDTIVLSYTNLPEISIEIEYKLHGRRYISEHTYSNGFTSLMAGLKLCELQKKMISAHGTPYPEEVVMLRAVALLPYPIAAAIEDCIRGVMERRFILYYAPPLCYTSYVAFKHELIYTAHPVRIDIHRNLIVNDRRNWEATVAPLIEEVTVRNAAYAEMQRNRNSSEDDLDSNSCWAPDDGW